MSKTCKYQHVCKLFQIVGSDDKSAGRKDLWKNYKLFFVCYSYREKKIWAKLKKWKLPGFAVSRDGYRAVEVSLLFFLAWLQMFFRHISVCIYNNLKTEWIIGGLWKPGPALLLRQHAGSIDPGGGWDSLSHLRAPEHLSTWAPGWKLRQSEGESVWERAALCAAGFGSSCPPCAGSGVRVHHSCGLSPWTHRARQQRKGQAVFTSYLRFVFN